MRPTPAVSPVEAQTKACTRLALEQDESGAGNAVELTLRFTGSKGQHCHTAAEDMGPVTIELPGEMGVSGLGKGDVTMYVVGSFQPQWIDVGTGDDNTHEIGLPNCVAWRDYNNAPPDCETSLNHFRIVLRNLRLPIEPPPDDRYEVSVKLAGIHDKDAPTADLSVIPVLQVDDAGESVRYGQKLTFTGVGFEGGSSVRLYAGKSNVTDERACDRAFGPSWREIATATAGVNHRFKARVTVKEAQFPASGRYLICPRGVTGYSEVHPGVVFVAGGVLVLSGVEEVSPGSDVLLLVSGNAGVVDRVTAEGIPAAIKSRSSNVLTVALPPRLSGVVTIRVNFRNGGSATVELTVSEASLTVAGLHGDGIALGGTGFVSAVDLPGSKVCIATLGDIPIALLDDRREFPPDGCIDVRRGGRFNATVLVTDREGHLTAAIINKVASLEPGQRLTLEVTDDGGHRASVLVPVAVPQVIVDPSDGIVKRYQPIIIRGRNFPPRRPDYYQVPPVDIKVGDRQVRRIYPSDKGDWEFEYGHTGRHQSGEWIGIEISLGNHRPRVATHNFRVRVAPFSLAVMPAYVRIGTPVVVTVTGLEPHTAGYGVGIRSGPHFSFEGSSSSFTTDRHGDFTGTARFPEYEPAAFDLNGEAVVFLQVIHGGRSLPGASAAVTLRRGHHPTPVFDVRRSTPTPEPTLALTPTPTPAVTFTPTPVLTQAPVAIAPATRAATPTPVPTDTPLPTSTIDRPSIAATAIASVAAPTKQPPVTGRTPGQSQDGANSGILFFLMIVPGGGLLLFIVVAVLWIHARRRSGV